MKKIVVVLLALGMMTMGLALIPTASAPPTGIDLSVGKYTGNLADYVPEERIEIKIYGPETESYDISIRDWPGGSEKKNWQDKSPNEDDVLMLEYDIPKEHADGFYRIFVCWDSVVTCDSTVDLIWAQYWLQLWTIDIETDRGDRDAYGDWHDGGNNLEDGCYLPDEVVTVRYSIVYRKDNTPVQTSDGYLDWSAYDFNGVKIGGEQDERVEGLGEFSFDLSASSSPLSSNAGDNYWIRAWYNDTNTATPDNRDYDYEYFYVGSLGVQVSLPWGATYEPGDQVAVNIQLFVDMGDPPNGIRTSDEAQFIPGTPLDSSINPAEVDINLFVFSGGDWDPDTQYDVEGLTPDDKGLTSYIFTLASGIADDTDYKVEGTASYVGVDKTSVALFTVTTTAGILRVTIKLDQLSYVSGDTITATATVSTSGTGSTGIIYTFSVYDYSQGAYMFIESQIGTSNTYQYQTTEDYRGTLQFRVEAKNQDGVEDTDTTNTNVLFGYLLVNVNKEEYNAGDTITVSYEIIGSLVDDNPTFYYYVVDASFIIVESGSTSGGSYSYVIPDVPSDWYQFAVVAYVNGRTLIGSDDSNLVDEYFIQITFDREIYSAGDTMKIHYKVVARGDSKLPSVFNLRYGVAGNPMEDYQTDNAEGDITYYLPSDMDQGTMIFNMNEATTGAATTQAITIRGGNPLWWAKLAEIPAFDIILLILIIILFIMLWRMRRGAPARASEEEPMAPEGEAAPPPPPPAGTAPMEEASAGPSAMSVPCKSCGTGIELTTSKRPIEVMCPSCGETQMVY